MLTLFQWQLCVDFGLLILIWLVQLIIYPSFLYCDRGKFVSWHNRYTGLIALFVGPLMLSQGLIYGFRLLTDYSWPTLFSAALIVISWLATILLSVPCHDSLHRKGWDDQVIQRLVRTNWIRTAAWTAVFLLNEGVFR